MSENSAGSRDVFDEIADSFWACLPEEAANNLAKCKSDGLTWLKNAVTQFVDNEIATTADHLRHAQNIRESRCNNAQQPPAGDATQPS